MDGITHRPRGTRRFAWLLAPLVAALFAAGALGATPVFAQTGSLTIQKELVDVNNNVVASSDLSGYTFTVALQNGTQVASATTPTNGTVTITGLPSGQSYLVSEQPRAGTTFVGFFDTNNAQLPSIVVIGANATTTLKARNRVAGTGSIVITKQVVDQAGLIVNTADRSGFQFVVAGPNAFNQTVSSDINGQATLVNLAAGNYTVTEQPRSGWTLVSSTVDQIPVANGATFPVQTTPRNVGFVNRQSTTAGTGTITISKSLVDNNNNPVGTGDRSGFQITIACSSAQPAFSQTVTTDANGAATVSNVPTGTPCTFTEAAQANRPTFASATIVNVGDITNGGQFTLNASTAITINVRNRVTGGGGTGQTEPVQLFPGCNNVTATWPTGTSITVARDAVTPANILIAIWRFDNVRQAFVGYSPIPGAPNDLLTMDRAQPIFLCVNGSGTWNRPVI